MMALMLTVEARVLNTGSLFLLEHPLDRHRYPSIQCITIRSSAGVQLRLDCPAIPNSILGALNTIIRNYM